MVGTPLLYRLPPPDISGPPTNEMFGRTPYERSRFARSTRSFIILTNGAHSSESFVTWETNFGAFDPDGANSKVLVLRANLDLLSLVEAIGENPRSIGATGSANDSRQVLHPARIHEGARALHTILLDADDEAQSGGALTCRR